MRKATFRSKTHKHRFRAVRDKSKVFKYANATTETDMFMDLSKWHSPDGVNPFFPGSPTHDTTCDIAAMVS